MSIGKQLHEQTTQSSTISTGLTQLGHPSWGKTMLS